jgi:hypothetical protein
MSARIAVNGVSLVRWGGPFVGRQIADLDRKVLRLARTPRDTFN